MTPTIPTRILLTAAAVVGGIGLLDAAESGDLDLVALFALLLALHLVLVSRLRGGRVEVPLRRDLVGWLRERSAVAGEPMEVIADRAVASYRAEYGDEESREVEVTR